MSTPVERYILEKIEHFVQYLLDEFPDNEDIQDKYSSTIDYIKSNFLGIPLIEFRRIMKENKDNSSDEMIITFAKDYNYDPEVLTRKQRHKIKQYIACFKDLYDLLNE